jgi:adenylate cyclase
MAHLEIREGVNAGKRFVLEGDMVLGRNAESSICLSETRVSRQHARITQQDSHFFLEDLYSSNGTGLRGKRILAGTLYELSHGDEIRIGSTLMVFVGGTEEVSSEAETRRIEIDEEALQDLTLEHMQEVPQDATLEREPGDRQELTLERDTASLSLRIFADDTAPSSVAMSLDASASMIEVNADAQSTNKELIEALKRLQAMCQVSNALGTITDQKQLMQKIIDCLFDMFPAAERAFILLHDKQSDTLVPVVAKKRQDGEEAREELAISRTVVREVLTHKRSILSVNTMEDDRFNQQQSVINLAIRSMMCAPLLVGEEILGLIQVDTHSNRQCFTSEDLQVLTGVSAQAAIAVKNAQLYEAVEAETARRTSLQRYFSPKLVEMLMSGDVTTALGGKAYQGTILFADIIGFTAMSEAMAPADVMGKLNRYFTIMQKLIHEHGGSIDKFSGDGIMAFWGVPRTGEHDESDAVFTALQMQKHLWTFNLELKAEEQHPVHMGIGLNTGEFIAGNVGSEDQIEFTLIGDHVNLASRIEHLAGRYQVLVSEASWQRIKHLGCAIQMPPVLVKGKSHPITTYSVRGLQHAQHHSYALILPCHILDADKSQVGCGLITGGQYIKMELQLRFNTNATLKRGQVLTLQVAMGEYHEPLLFSAQVRTCFTGMHQDCCTYTKAILSDIRGEQLTAFLTPGSCLATTYTWEDLRRS